MRLYRLRVGQGVANVIVGNMLTKFVKFFFSKSNLRVLDIDITRVKK